MMRKTSVLLGWLLSLVFVGPLWANPQGGVVMHGSVQVPGLPPNTLPTVNMRALEIHNAPNTVINWQSFGIDVNEVTSFVQQSAQSAVLNRVVGQELSSLLGRLESNGRVYLLNPNGVIVGQGAVIDTAGFIASALSMTDEDFLAGQLRFAGDGTEGPVINRGYIRTSETGDVLLVAPSVTNEGVIETQGGNVVLAAGKSVVITSLEDVDVEYEVSAPSDSAVNLGEVITGGGAAAIFAGTIQNRGRLDATTLVVDESGEIRLVASDAVELTADSVLIANGADGGQVSVTSGGGLAVEGVIEAKGEAGTGGEIDLTGAELVLTAATVEASGTTGGGRVRVGGEFQGGRDLAVDELTNAETVTIDSSSRLVAEGLGPDAPGGEVIVWSEGETVVSGEVSAMPGAEGLGGFVELSGKGELIFRGSVAAGAGGTVLFDPQYVVVDDLGQSAVGDATSDGVLGQVTLDPATVETLLDQGTDVLLQADNDIYVRSDILVTGTPTTPASLTLEAGRSIEIEALITTNNGNLIARANAPFGRISDGSLDLGTGPGNIFVRDKAQDAVVGTYGVNAGSGFVQLISLPFNAAISNSEQGGIYLTHNDFEADTVRVSADTIEMIGMGVEFSGPFSSGGALLVEGADITVRSESGLSLAPVINASSNLSISAPALCVGAVEVSCGFEASIEPAVIEPILLQGGNVQLLSNFDTYVQESIDAASGTGSLLLDAGGTLEINASLALGGDLVGIAQSPTLGIGGLDSTPHLSLTADDFNGDVVVSANSIYLELVNDPSWGVTEWEELYLRTAGISQGFALSLSAATDLTLKAGYIFVKGFGAAAGSVLVEAQNINLSALRTWTDPVSTSQYSDGYIEIWSGIQGQSGTPTIDLTATQNLNLDAAGAIWISAGRGSVGLAGNNIGVQVTDGTYARYDLSLGLLDGGAYPLELDTYSYIEIVSGGGAVDFSATDALQLTASGHVLISDLGLGNVSLSGGNTVDIVNTLGNPGLYGTSTAWYQDLAPDLFNVIGPAEEVMGVYAADLADANGASVIVSSNSVKVRSESDLLFSSAYSASALLGLAAPDVCVSTTGAGCGAIAPVLIDPALLTPLLDQGTDFELAADNDIEVMEGISATGAGSLLLDAGRNLNINADVIVGGDLTGRANSPTLALDGLRQTGFGGVDVRTPEGSGDVTVSAANILLEALPGTGVYEPSGIIAAHALGQTVGQTLSMSAAGALTLVGPAVTVMSGYVADAPTTITADGALSLTAEEHVQLISNGGSLGVSGQDVNLTAFSEFTNNSSQLETQGLVRIQSTQTGGALTLSADPLAGTLTVTAGREVDLWGGLGPVALSARDISINASGEVISQAGESYGIGLVALSGAAVPVTDQNNRIVDYTGGLLSLTAGGTLEINASGGQNFSDPGFWEGVKIFGNAGGVSLSGTDVRLVSELLWQGTAVGNETWSYTDGWVVIEGGFLTLADNTAVGAPVEITATGVLTIDSDFVNLGASLGGVALSGGTVEILAQAGGTWADVALGESVVDSYGEINLFGGAEYVYDSNTGLDVVLGGGVSLTATNGLSLESSVLYVDGQSGGVVVSGGAVSLVALGGYSNVTPSSSSSSPLGSVDLYGGDETIFDPQSGNYLAGGSGAVSVVATGGALSIETNTVYVVGGQGGVLLSGDTISASATGSSVFSDPTGSSNSPEGWITLYGGDSFVYDPTSSSYVYVGGGVRLEATNGLSLLADDYLFAEAQTGGIFFSGSDVSLVALGEASSDYSGISQTVTGSVELYGGDLLIYDPVEANSVAGGSGPISVTATGGLLSIETGDFYVDGGQGGVSLSGDSLEVSAVSSYSYTDIDGYLSEDTTGGVALYGGSTYLYDPVSSSEVVVGGSVRLVATNDLSLVAGDGFSVSGASGGVVVSGGSVALTTLDSYFYESPTFTQSGSGGYIDLNGGTEWVFDPVSGTDIATESGAVEVTATGGPLSIQTGSLYVDGGLGGVSLQGQSIDVSAVSTSSSDDVVTGSLSEYVSGDVSFSGGGDSQLWDPVSQSYGVLGNGVLVEAAGEVSLFSGNSLSLGSDSYYGEGLSAGGAGGVVVSGGTVNLSASGSNTVDGVTTTEGYLNVSGGGLVIYDPDLGIDTVKGAPVEVSATTGLLSLVSGGQVLLDGGYAGATLSGNAVSVTAQSMLADGSEGGYIELFGGSVALYDSTTSYGIYDRVGGGLAVYADTTLSLLSGEIDVEGGVGGVSLVGDIVSLTAAGTIDDGAGNLLPAGFVELLGGIEYYARTVNFESTAVKGGPVTVSAGTLFEVTSSDIYFEGGVGGVAVAAGDVTLTSTSGYDFFTDAESGAEQLERFSTIGIENADPVEVFNVATQSFEAVSSSLVSVSATGVLDITATDGTVSAYDGTGPVSLSGSTVTITTTGVENSVPAEWVPAEVASLLGTPGVVSGIYLIASPTGGGLSLSGDTVSLRSDSDLLVNAPLDVSTALTLSAPDLCVAAIGGACGSPYTPIDPLALLPALDQGADVALLANRDIFINEAVVSSGGGSLVLDAGGSLEINASLALGGDLVGIAQSPTLGIGGLDSTPHLSLTADDFNGDVVVSANSIYLELVNDPSWGVTEWEELYLQTAGISQGFALSLTAATDLTLKAGYIFVHDFSAAAGSVSVEAQNINLSALRTWTDPVSANQYSDGYIEIWSGIQGQSGTPTIDLTATQNLNLDAAGAIWISADRGSVGLAGNNIGVQVTDGTYARYDLTLGLLDGGAYPLELDTYSYIEIVSGGGAVDFSATDALQLTASGHVLISDLGLGNVSLSGGNTVDIVNTLGNPGLYGTSTTWYQDLAPDLFNVIGPAEEVMGVYAADLADANGASVLVSSNSVKVHSESELVLVDAMVDSGVGPLAFDGGYVELTRVSALTPLLSGGAVSLASSGALALYGEYAASDIPLVSTPGSLLITSTEGVVDRFSPGTQAISSGSLVVSGGSFEQAADSGDISTGDFVLSAGATYLLNGGTLSVSSSMNLLGTLIAGGGLLDYTSSVGFSVPVGGTVNWPGNFVVSSGTTVIDGTLNVDGDLLLDGGLLGGAGLISIAGGSGNFNMGNASLVSSGATTPLSIQGNLLVAPGGDGFASLGGWLDIDGTVELLGPIGGSGVLSAGGGAGTIKLGAGSLSSSTAPGAFTIEGNLLVDPGAGLAAINGWLGVNGDVSVTSGTVSGNGVLSIRGGSGMLTVGAATLSAGQSPGSLTIEGDLQLGPSSTFLVELGGVNPGVDYDLVTVTGLAALDGALEVVSWAGYEPSDGAVFEPLRYGSVSGDFASVSSNLSQTVTTSIGTSSYQLIAGVYTPPSGPDVPEEIVDAAEEPELVIQDANVLSDSGGDLLDTFESEDPLVDDVLEEETASSETGTEEDAIAVGSGELEGEESDSPVSQFCSG